MNWVPGNLHLIGKDNQNNHPLLPNKVKTSSCPPPTLSLQACRDNGGGEAHKCCTHHETQLLQKDSHCKTILFLYSFPVPAIYHITLSGKTIWSGDTCFSFLPAYSHNVHGPEGVRTIPEEVVTRFPTRIYALPAPSAHIRQLIYKIRGLWWSVSQAESLLSPNQFKIWQTIPRHGL